MRIDVDRNLPFVPSYDQAIPWVPRFEDLHLVNRALYPELEPVREITEPENADAPSEDEVMRSAAWPPAVGS